MWGEADSKNIFSNLSSMVRDRNGNKQQTTLPSMCWSRFEIFLIIVSNSTVLITVDKMVIL